jgi:hypothetical protein
VDSVCDYVRRNPGKSGAAIERGMRDFRKDGVLTVPFQNPDVRKAIAKAVERGLVRREGEGKGRAIKHYPVDLVQAESESTSSGRGS